jgi:hypothetical protein
MIPALLAAFDLTVAAAPNAACTPAALEPAVKAAAAAMQTKDWTGAKAALGAGPDCPVRDGATYVVHAMRASIASHEGDWAGVRAALAALALPPELGLSARVGLLRLAADQALKDPNAFAHDREALLAADDARLAAVGRRVERFHAGGATVTAYETSVQQGAFHRVMEFVITPDDPAAYPASIQLTDDAGAMKVAQALNHGPDQPTHDWFLDLYTCTAHATLPRPGKAFGDQPDYTAVKAQVMASLSAPIAFTPAAAPEGGCFTAPWLLPGFGAR